MAQLCSSLRGVAMGPYPNYGVEVTLFGTVAMPMGRAALFAMAARGPGVRVGGKSGGAGRAAAGAFAPRREHFFARLGLRTRNLPLGIAGLLADIGLARELHSQLADPGRQGIRVDVHSRTRFFCNRRAGRCTGSIWKKAHGQRIYKIENERPADRSRVHRSIEQQAGRTQDLPCSEEAAVARSGTAHAARVCAEEEAGNQMSKE